MSSVETVSALERSLSASIPQQNIRSQIDARLKKIGRTAKIAGFRPGKIPPKILEQHYGTEVRQEVLGEALQQSFGELVQANNLTVAGYPEFRITSLDLDADPIEYKATFEVYPEVVLGDVGNETVERFVFNLEQADVDNTIATLRKQRATFEEVSREAQSGDQVHIDFTGKLNGEVFQGGEAKDYPFVLGAGRMLPDFEAAITGMKAGETKSFDMTFSEEYHSKDIAGKQVTFTITLNRVEAPKLPELDAEFAKSIGIEDGDISRMGDEIRKNLNREIANRLKARNKEVAMNALMKVAQFDLPKSMVQGEMQTLMEQARHDMKSRGIKVDGKQLPPEWFRERAEKRVKLGLIFADLVEKHDLSAKPEQVSALIDSYAQSYEQPEEVTRWYYADPARLQEVVNLVLEDNVAKWAMDHAKVTDKAISFNELMGN